MIHTRFWFVHTIYGLFICMRVFFLHMCIAGCVSATFFMFYKHSLSEFATAHHIYRQFTQNVSSDNERNWESEKGSACSKTYLRWYRLSLCHDHLHVKLSKFGEVSDKFNGSKKREAKGKRMKTHTVQFQMIHEPKKVESHKSTAKNDFLYLA